MVKEIDPALLEMARNAEVLELAKAELAAAQSALLVLYRAFPKGYTSPAEQSALAKARTVLVVAGVLAEERVEWVDRT